MILSLLWAALTFRLTTTPNLVVAPDTILNTILMNGAHFGFFGIQAALLYLTFSKSRLLPIILTSAYGYWIELLQRTIPGRTYDLVDWSLDTLGAMIFVLIVTQSLNRIGKYVKRQ